MKEKIFLHFTFLADLRVCSDIAIAIIVTREWTFLYENSLQYAQFFGGGGKGGL